MNITPSMKEHPLLDRLWPGLNVLAGGPSSGRTAIALYATLSVLRRSDEEEDGRLPLALYCDTEADAFERLLGSRDAAVSSRLLLTPSVEGLAETLARLCPTVAVVDGTGPLLRQPYDVRYVAEVLGPLAAKALAVECCLLVVANMSKTRCKKTPFGSQAIPALARSVLVARSWDDGVTWGRLEHVKRCDGALRSSPAWYAVRQGGVARVGEIPVFGACPECGAVVGLGDHPDGDDDLGFLYSASCGHAFPLNQWVTAQGYEV